MDRVVKKAVGLVWGQGERRMGFCERAMMSGLSKAVQVDARKKQRWQSEGLTGNEGDFKTRGEGR